MLEKHDLATDMLRVVNDILQAKGLLMKKGTVVDATLIAAPSSTKNADGERDPEMKQTRKGNQWYFGMKAQIGVDAESGLVHSVIGTAASLNDSDKEWLASRLNGNFALSSAVCTYMKAATDYLETTEDNPRYGGMSPINLQLVDYNFKDVKGQLAGKIAFKELIAATWKKYDFGPEIKVDPADFRGGDSLEMLALRLVASKD